ncbi:MAG TPA: 50S ribosomal protein L10 [Nitrospiria bacterium]|nr:50S ribosomal protein L10 [Nitrospiria bacterium]
MDRTEKTAEIADIASRFKRAKVVILSEYSGLKVEDLRQLRMNVRKTNGEFKVMKNTLVEKAVEDSEFKPIQSYLRGPVGVVFGYDDPVGPIKAVKEFAEKQKVFKMKAGMMEGRLLSISDIAAVATLPPKQVMIGQLLSRMQSPIYGFVGTLSGIIRKFAYVLQAVKEQKESSGG